MLMMVLTNYLITLCSNKTNSQIMSMEFNVLDSLNASLMRPVSLCVLVCLSVSLSVVTFVKYCVICLPA